MTFCTSLRIPSTLPSKLLELSKIFCGLMSRCAIFLRCKYSRALRTSLRQVFAVCSERETSSSRIACNSPPAALKGQAKRRKLIKIARIQFVCFNLHLKNQDKLAARLVHSVELNDLLGIGAQQQNSDLMLNLFDPAGSASSASQEFRSVVNASLFVSCSSNGAKIASEKKNSN